MGGVAFEIKDEVHDIKTYKADTADEGERKEGAGRGAVVVAEIGGYVVEVLEKEKRATKKEDACGADVCDDDVRVARKGFAAFHTFTLLCVYRYVKRHVELYVFHEIGERDFGEGAGVVFVEVVV